MIGIYKITEIATGMCYIGQSVCIESRWKKHRRRFRLDAHTYEVLMECDADVLDFFEKAFISGYDCIMPKGLNKTIGGTFGRIGPNSKEHNLKISETLKGHVMSEETRKKISDACKGKVPPNKGKTLSAEHCQKLKESAVGRKMPPRSEEHKRRMSESQKKRYNKEVCHSDI